VTAEVLRYAAFAVDGAGGNPAGVVLDAGSLSDGQMRAIAAAIGYSETAFVVPTDTGPALRFFSPVAEVAFCGHATIATAVALAERNGPGRLRMITPAGPVTVRTRTEGGDVVATLTSPPTVTRPVEEPVLTAALQALHWTRDQLDPRYPVHAAYAGNHHLVLGVRDRNTLAGLDYDYPALEALMARERWTTAHLFWSETTTIFHVRNPFPPGGVVEDPATGAAAAAFAGYLRNLGLVPVPSRITLHQGYDMGSPSRLLVDVDPDASFVDVTGAATQLPLSPYDELEPALPTTIQPVHKPTGGSSFPPSRTPGTGGAR
jgi:PhzF family phenazine biosynthesis protein